MFPSKSTLDYMSEMNRLFPKTEEFTMDHTQLAFTPNTYHSPYQSKRYNRSSSSTDSTSPESYPDFSFHGAHYSKPQDFQEISTIQRPHRAIVGRKIIETIPQSKPSIERDMDFNLWKPENFLESPENSIQSTRSLYSLFPDNAHEFKTPVKSNPFTSDISPNRSQFANILSLANRSPTLTDRSLINDPMISPMSSQADFLSFRSRSASNQSNPMSYTAWPTSQSPSFTPSSNTYDFGQNYAPNYGNVRASPSDHIAPNKMCSFCRKNGETPVVYMNHRVKEKVRGKTVVTCPILRSHVCAVCGVSGDNAHTITYCPVLRSNNDGKPLQSTTITLKSTRIKSNGRRRF